MDLSEILGILSNGSLYTPELAETKAPASPGYYSIYVDSAASLPGAFAAHLESRGSLLIYLGIATTSILARLIEQDLRHMRASTFFRGIGAVLGYRPPQGSLIGKKNRNNYRFVPADTRSIIRWIDDHLKVTWHEEDPAIAATEVAAIRHFAPLLNTTHNPRPLAELAELRAECRRIASETL